MVAGPTPTSLRAHQFAGLAAGPRLLVLGAVHGNETCGTRAIERLIQEIDSGALAIERGTLTLVPVANPLAYQLQRRQGDRNLNRNLRPKTEPTDFEDRVATVLCRWIDEHDVLLDLHSFHTPGRPFVMVGPQDNQGEIEPFAHAAQEQRLAAHLGPQRIVEGWMDTYARGVRRRRAKASALAPTLLDVGYGVGTAEYMRERGGYGVTLECGQHEDPEAPEIAYRAIRQALALLGLASLPLDLPSGAWEVLRLIDVVDRADEGDHFVQPWRSFDPVLAGQHIGVRETGEQVLAPTDGFIVFPNPSALVGNEWFYFAQRSSRQLL